MSLRGKLDRRLLLGLMLSTVLSRRLMAQVFAAPPGDQGIGGTGAAPQPIESDRGIGGTGVIGTIRKFGSIIVNDLRIAYASDADVRIDGRPAGVSDLKIGQVVRVAANGDKTKLFTGAIDVTSEVVGPIDKVGAKQLVVLGQTVATGAVKTKGLKAGDVVAVSGLRRNDGTIVASLIERRDGVSYRVAGPIDVARDGALRIGNLHLTGVNPDLIGRRAVLEGARTGDQFNVTHGTSEAALLPSGIATLSVESYVERRGGDITLGSGFTVDGIDTLQFPAGQSVRSVITASVGSDGRLTVDSLRAGSKTYDAPAGSAGNRDTGGGETGGSRSPMTFGPQSGARPGEPNFGGQTGIGGMSGGGGPPSGPGAPGGPGSPGAAPPSGGLRR